MLVAAYLKELPFEALIRLLEEGQENSPYHPIEAHPQLLPKVLRLEEVEEDVHKWRMAKVVTKDGEGLYKGPVVGVQLGRGHVDLSYESMLGSRERKAKFEPLKGGGIHEEEGFFGGRAVVDTHGFTLLTGQNLHINIMLAPEDVELLVRLAFLVRINVLKGVYLISFGQKVSGTQ